MEKRGELGPACRTAWTENDAYDLTIKCDNDAGRHFAYQKSDHNWV